MLEEHSVPVMLQVKLDLILRVIEGAHMKENGVGLLAPAEPRADLAKRIIFLPWTRGTQRGGMEVSSLRYSTDAIPNQITLCPLFRNNPSLLSNTVNSTQTKQ